MAEKAFTDSSSPFVLCVTQTKPFGRALDALQGKWIKGRRWEIRTVHSPSSVRKCHVLFFTSSGGKAEPMLTSLKEMSVLTVGESEGFLQAGGMINFVLVNNKINFEINVDAAEKPELKIS